MVAKGNRQTFYHKESFHSAEMPYTVTWSRNLSKNQLGGVIFGCTNSTMEECLSKQIFGLPGQHFSYVKNIEPGLPLFLFNYSDRKLHGIYEAASSGKMNIDPYAWTIDGSEKTKFPAQVQIRVRLQCQALTELQFKLTIIDNYYGQIHFRFELDHAQASKLLSQLSSLAVAPRISIQKNPPIYKPNRMGPSNYKKNENGVPEPPKSTDNLSNYGDSISTSTTSDDSLWLNGSNQLMQETCKQLDEKNLVYMKLKDLALTYMPSMSDTDLVCGTPGDDQVSLGKRDSGSSSSILDYPTIVEQLSMEIEDLKTFKQEQILKTQSLVMKLAEAEKEILQLQNRCMALEYFSNASEQPLNVQTPVESPDEFHWNLNESILIVGGYDGVSWSSALHSFLPSKDIVRSLRSMSSARWNAPFVAFNGELYVFGGGSGPTFHNTVESYNIVENEWTPRPSLIKAKGSLAGAVLNNKIFAIGGGNGVDFFSDVDMFDPYVGRWIPSRSMLQKRHTLAAVELNGAIYAVGGFDGTEYLNSAERFDPREHSWTRIASMETRRGLHSLVTVNEKLYAIGGFDGTAMIPSVEIYDPRRGEWMAGDSMNQCRGYSAAAVLNESIFVIGGIKTDEEIVDMVECYKEGEGWEKTKLRALGKRCFASTIVLEGN